MTPTSLFGTRVRILTVALILFTTPLTACLSYQRQGDYAFEEGKCGEALEFYGQAVEEGNKDPEMYRRAAQCALEGGDFSTAERYYSQALRYGAGIDVARELADFYIKTSNYASAIRVYQYLLHREADKQPVYNNMGTALMYAGHHFDAESYLMIAQQMDPKDPTPYLNLGVLYDRHLRQPWLAINFYECFLQMSGGDERVTQRVNELQSRWGKLYEEGLVGCGEPYQKRPPKPVRDLKSALVIEGEDEESAEQPTPGDPPIREEDATGDGEPTTRPIEVETMVSREETPDDPKPEKKPTPEEMDASALQKAKEAFEDERWADTVSQLTSVPLSRLGVEERRMLGLAYLEQSNWTQAAHWLDQAHRDAPTPQLVNSLLKAYRRSGEWDRVLSLCKKYGNRSEYEKIIARRCEIPSVDEK